MLLVDDEDLIRSMGKEMLERIGRSAAKGVTTVLMQGGVNKTLPFDYYLDLVRGVREHYELGALLDYFSQLRDRFVVVTPQFAVHAKTIAPHLEYFSIEEILNGKMTFEQALRGSRNCWSRATTT